MITISLCMIVKNEEKSLPGILSDLKDVVDEILIADTGSSDRTKEVAASFGATVYDFQWINDFSAARNFIFSKATCDYIFSADADERIDEVNQKKLLSLKERIRPETEIVQMYYSNQLAYRTVYNYDEELRPKMFKRIRTFHWEGNVHEQVRLDPVVYDSDIVVRHHPDGSHAARDLQYFREAVINQGRLPSRLNDMYARELYMAGTDDDFLQAEQYFSELCSDPLVGEDDKKDARVILVRCAWKKNDDAAMMKWALQDIAVGSSSEMCCQIGDVYLDRGEYEEALVWFERAKNETVSILDARSSSEYAEAGIKAANTKRSQRK